MRKPYDRILVISIVITALYFLFFDNPTATPYQDDQKNILLFAVLYTGLIFGILSLIYMASKKGGNNNNIN